MDLLSGSTRSNRAEGSRRSSFTSYISRSLLSWPSPPFDPRTHQPHHRTLAPTDGPDAGGASM